MMSDLRDGVDTSQISTSVDDLASCNTQEQYLEKVRQIFDIYGLGHACLLSSISSSFPVEGLWRKVPGDVSQACEKLTLERVCVE